MRMQPAGVRENDPRKQAKEDEEGDGAGVEHILLFELIAKLGVNGGESDGSRKIHVGLDKGDDLGTGFGGGNHQHILGIAKDGVVEKDAEEHEGQRQELLALICWGDHVFELLEEILLHFLWLGGSGCIGHANTAGRRRRCGGGSAKLLEGSKSTGDGKSHGHITRRQGRRGYRRSISEITDARSHGRREAGTATDATEAGGGDRRLDNVGGCQRRRPCDEEGRQYEIGEIGSGHPALENGTMESCFGI
mmetsp:Transcript_1129/g.3191  ORF Transcript_1129/g.3191 Transcript_1129/m.3191 type:complete len:249 (-) Transcript_1129:65-811(-)